MTTMRRPLEEHPLLRCLSRVDRALDDVAGLDPTFLPTSDKARALRAVDRELARLEGLRLELLAASADVAAEAGARSAGVWLAEESRSGAASGVGDQRVADALSRWPAVLVALRDGVVNAAQASVIVRALEALPAELDAELAAKACAQLVADAGHFGPRDLRVLGRRVLEVVAPDVAEAQEGALLAAEEQRARAETRVWFRPRGDGVTDVCARVPDHVADRLRAYLDAFTSPRRRHLDSMDEGGSGSPWGALDGLTLPRRRGEAFCALLEHIPAEGLPVHGGTATSVVVTLDYETLCSGVGAAQLSTGGRITATEARRLACTALVLPAVLGGAGEVLELGRSRRLFSPAQRKALGIRDRTCRAEGCDIPAAWCEAHHAQSLGPRADAQIWPMACSFVRSTITARTTTGGTRPDSPKARSDTCAGRERIPRRSTRLQ
jgi:hypothetical protein